MKLPTLKVVERHYWTFVIKDQFRPEGEEYPAQYETKAEAEDHVERMIKKRLGTRER
jgi:hypothetical protein